MAATFLPVVEQEALALLDEVRSHGGVLDDDHFLETWYRVVRRVVLGARPGASPVAAQQLRAGVPDPLTARTPGRTETNDALLSSGTRCDRPGRSPRGRGTVEVTEPEPGRIDADSPFGPVVDLAERLVLGRYLRHPIEKRHAHLVGPRPGC